MYESLQKVIEQSEFWNGSRVKTHSFLLSPDVYEVNDKQVREFERLGYAIHDCLLGLSHIATITYDDSLNYKGAWNTMRKIFSSGVPTVYQKLQGKGIRKIPHLLKVDLMIDQNGMYKIAEIDGHNKHGVGYSTLAARLRRALYPDARVLPGVVALLSKELRENGHTVITIMYSDRERFYLPEFEVARDEFKKHDIACKLLKESDAVARDVMQGMFLDLPFLYERGDLYNTIVQAYEEKEVDFIIPPKPFLGAKGVLALLRNDNGDAQVEAILRSFINKYSLDTVRKYIPKTYLVGTLGLQKSDVETLLMSDDFVLKESISYGMKGTVFSDDKNFSESLETACKARLNWILQEAVTNQPQRYSWYEESNSTMPTIYTKNDWFTRVTVQYVNRKLADIIVTARRDKSVHGAKDCLQLGTIIT